MQGAGDDASGASAPLEGLGKVAVKEIFYLDHISTVKRNFTNKESRLLYVGQGALSDIRLLLRYGHEFTRKLIHSVECHKRKYKFLSFKWLLYYIYYLLVKYVVYF